MAKPLNVLIVDDSEDDALLIVRELRRGGYEPNYERIDTAVDLNRALDEKNWQIILSDHNMPGFGSMEALACLNQRSLDIPFIIISGAIGEEAAVQAMKSGASDYLLKGNLGRLVVAIDRELREVEVRSEKRKIEDQLRHSQKLEAFGQLTGGIAHDFNNLLTAIVGPAHRIHDRMSESDPDRKWIEMIMQAGTSAVNLVSQLLAFSRKQIVQPKTLNLNALISNTEKMLKRIIGEQVKIVVRTDEKTENIFADGGQIEQVLLNLAVNARDAMPNGGTLTIATMNSAAVKEHSKEVNSVEYILLTVTDTGTGMSKDVQAKIFEPFFTTKEPGKGTGLGLATCYGIVQQARGRICVHSELGKGTAFQIYLPKTAEIMEDTSDPTTAERAPLGNERILMVEDDPLLCELGSALLRDYGYTVITAGQGEEALRLLQNPEQGVIDVLITDLVMPGMGGKQLSERVKQLKPGIEIIFMSGHTDDTTIEHGINASEVHFIKKPFFGRILPAKVREVLDNRKRKQGMTANRKVA